MNESRLRLSVVVISYEMTRELPRTIRSLSPEMQRGIAADDYELIVVDNGSRQPPTEATCPAHGANIRWLSQPDAGPSPVRAVNQGIDAARGDVIGVMIDGARLVSPGLLAGALMGAKLHQRPVVASLGYHLGSELQRIALKNGYDQAVEDDLLERVRWHEDGYRLFEVSVFAGSSKGGYFAPLAESSALFMPRALWSELGGYDERFEKPGGGLVNLDTYGRACLLPDVGHVVLLGEATFHQVHGGAVTNADAPPWEDFQSDYARIRGERFTVPRIEPVFVGRVHEATLPSLASSAQMPDAAKWNDAAPGRGAATVDNVAKPRCGLSGAQLSAIQSGVLRTRYRDRKLLKSPFDLVLYTQLVQRLRPRTVIELGSCDGGSALWFADLLANHDIDAQVFSIDRVPPEAAEHDAVTFLAADVRHLGAALGDEWGDELPHPFLVIEDSAHDFETTMAALEFFHPWLLPGDYICVEDGVVRFLPEEQYRRYEEGPTRAIAALLERYPGKYEIDHNMCDYFGKNVTYNPNGYLTRVS